MYEEYICNAARTMAETMKNADIPMYGNRLRLPDRKAIITLLKEMRQLMFPAYFGDPALMTLAAADYAALLLERIETSLSQQIALALPLEDEGRAPQIAREVVEQLPRIQQLLLTDIDAIFDGDPAAQNREEIVLAYPGLFAIFAYRVSHELYLRHVPTIPRMMTEYAHSRTGIDIHPGAQIGSYFFIAFPDESRKSRIHRHCGRRDHHHRRPCEAVSGRDAGRTQSPRRSRSQQRQTPPHRGRRRHHLLRRVHLRRRDGHRRKRRGGRQRLPHRIRGGQRPRGDPSPGNLYSQFVNNHSVIKKSVQTCRISGFFARCGDMG